MQLLWTANKVLDKQLGVGYNDSSMDILEREREDEHIFVQELEQSVVSGELLEDYPDDPRGHSCLILGFTRTGRAIHSMWGLLPDGRVRVITMYLPLPPKWVDPRTRRGQRNDAV